jgi:hypothetical protein
MWRNIGAELFSSCTKPPLLKDTAGRPKTERHKGCSEKKRKSDHHKCPICTYYGYHWHNCKRGNPDDISAMMDVR